MKSSAFYFLLITLFFYACDKEKLEVENIDMGLEYAALEIGRTHIYKVDSIVYNDFILPVSIDSFSYYVRERISNEFSDLENRPSYKVERHLKKDSLDNWELEKVFSLHLSSHRIEKLEDNLFTIPLTFPIKENAYWNGNALNAKPYREYKYQKVHQADSSLWHSFDSTLLVVQLDEENLLERKYITETYAKGVGLIKKESISLQTSFQGEIKSGTEVYYHLIVY